MRDTLFRFTFPSDLRYFTELLNLLLLGDVSISVYNLSRLGLGPNSYYLFEFSPSILDDRILGYIRGLSRKVHWLSSESEDELISFDKVRSLSAYSETLGLLRNQGLHVRTLVSLPYNIEDHLLCLVVSNVQDNIERLAYSIQSYYENVQPLPIEEVYTASLLVEVSNGSISVVTSELKNGIPRERNLRGLSVAYSSREGYRVLEMAFTQESQYIVDDGITRILEKMPETVVMRPVPTFSILLSMANSDNKGVLLHLVDRLLKDSIEVLSMYPSVRQGSPSITLGCTNDANRTIELLRL